MTHVGEQKFHVSGGVAPMNDALPYLETKR